MDLLKQNARKFSMVRQTGECSFTYLCARIKRHIGRVKGKSIHTLLEYDHTHITYAQCNGSKSMWVIFILMLIANAIAQTMHTHRHIQYASRGRRCYSSWSHHSWKCIQYLKSLYEWKLHFMSFVEWETWRAEHRSRWKCSRRKIFVELPYLMHSSWKWLRKFIRKKNEKENRRFAVATMGWWCESVWSFWTCRKELKEEKLGIGTK